MPAPGKQRSATGLAAGAAGTPFGLAAAQHGTPGLIIGGMVVITMAALASDQPGQLLALILGGRQRRCSRQHPDPIDDAADGHVIHATLRARAPSLDLATDPGPADPGTSPQRIWPP